MVFESVLAEILNKYLKPYVKKLDNSQLKIGVWKGNVSLGKLELKDDLFEEFDLPLKISASYIGSINMKIPWKRLAKDPIIIEINEVYIVVSPCLDQPYDKEKDLKRKRKEKEEQIQKIEEAAKKLKKKQKKKQKEVETEKPDTFTEKLAAHLVKNLQVRISNIHVRYEDSVTNPSSVIAAGATLSSLELKSTDSNWVPCVVKETATLIYKLIELNCVGVYWSTVEQCLSDLPNNEWMNAMKMRIAVPGVEYPSVNKYVLQPMSASARVKLNLKPGLVMDLPQLFGGLECKEISLSLSEDQFKSLMFTLDAFNRHKLNLKYLKYKPVKPVKEDVSAWWKYAYDAVTEEMKKRRMGRWENMKEHIANCRLYKKKYYEKLTAINPSSSLLQEIESLEDKLDVFNLMLCRKAAKKRKKKQPSTPSSLTGSGIKQAVSVSPVPSLDIKQAAPVTVSPPPPVSPSPPPVVVEKPAEKGKKLSAPSKGATPFLSSSKKGAEKTAKKEKKKKPSFWSRIKSPKKEVLAPPSLLEEEPLLESSASAQSVFEETSEKDREEFYKSIGYSEDEEYTEFPKEYIAHHIDLSLQKLSINLSGRRGNLATVVTDNVSVTVRNRPSSQSVSVRAEVGGVNVTGVPHGNHETLMVTADKASGSDGDVKSKSSLVVFELSLNPLDQPGKDIVVRANIQPLKVIYDEDTVDGLVGAFRIRKNIHLQELTTAASSTFEQLRAQTAAGLQEAIQNRKQVDIDITINSPYILVPEGGHYTHGRHLLLIDLGQLSLSGQTQDPKTLFKELTSRQTFSNFYDTFNVKLSALQVLVAKPEDDWQAARLSKSTPLHILDPTGFGIELKKSIVEDDALLPSLQIVGDIKGFDVKINDVKLRSILRIVNSLQLPPPSLKNTTSYYNELPPPPSVSGQDLFGDAPLDIARTVSMDTMSVLSYDDEDSLHASVSSSPEREDDSTAQVVFTDVKVKLTIKKISISLNQLETNGSEKPLLSVAVNMTTAEVNDRNWDVQGKLSVREVAVMDYINKNAKGEPTYLMKTHPLIDGNFLSVRFVSITAVGQDFASKYTGLENTANIQMSLIEISLSQATITALMKLGLSLKPALENRDSTVDTLPETSVAGLDTKEELVFSKTKAVTTPPKEFRIEASFEGIQVGVLGAKQEVVHAFVKGFSVVADLKAKEHVITASMKDVVVKNPSAGDDVPNTVQKVDSSNNMIQLKVTVNKQEKVNWHDLSVADVSLEADIQRLQAYVDTGFLSNVLGFVKQLQLDSEQLIEAYKATSDKAQVTVQALKDPRQIIKPPFLVKLSVSLSAPHVVIPFSGPTVSGTLHIVLGDFTLTNRFSHGYEVMDNRASVISIGAGQVILDRMEVNSSSICIYRENSDVDLSGGMTVRTDIMDPLRFTAIVTRNLSGAGQSGMFPDVAVTLAITDEIEFHVTDEDVEMFLAIALTMSKIGDALAPTDKPHPPRSRTLTKARAVTQKSRSGTLGGSRPLSGLGAENRTKLKVDVELDQVSVELIKGDHSLVKSTGSKIAASVELTSRKVLINASVGDMGVSDVAYSLSQRQVLSFTEGWQKALQLRVEVPIDQASQDNEVTPAAKISATVGQMQLYIGPSLIKKLLDFALSININPQLVKSATKAAQDGAIVANELAKQVFVELKLCVHAPNIIFSVDGRTGFMFDLGRLELKNEVSLDQDVTLDLFGITLRNFKASRVILKEEKLDVAVERVIIQPYSLMIDIKRNLCPWITKYPTLSVSFHMGTFTLCLGEEDLQTAVNVAISVAESVVPLIKKKSNGMIAGAVVEGLTETDSQDFVPVAEEEEERYMNVSLKVFLAQFQIDIFKNEPKLESHSSGIQTLSADNGLASFQLVAADLTTSVYSNGDVEVSATVKDFALLDMQEESKGKNTGNRVLQHYTRNPLQAYTGKIDKPLLGVVYTLVNKEHSVRLRANNVLLLSDIGFIKTIADYFKALFGDIKLPQLEESDSLPVATTPAVSEGQTRGHLPSLEGVPPLKITADIADIRVAVIEDVESTNPQALMLKVSTYCQVKLNAKDNVKQASLNVADLGITTCSFYDLGTATSAVLLPLNMYLSVNGPMDNLTAMDIHGAMQNVSLKLSPPIVRLIIHAVKTLALTPDKPVPPPAPCDLWEKKPVNLSKLWYLLPVPLHAVTDPVTEVSSTEDRKETLTMTFEGFELMLETEATDRVPAVPVLSLNAKAVVQVFDWTGELSVTGDAQCEASYFNQSLSVWEPLIEPLEVSNGRLQQWRINLQVNRSLAPVSSPAVSVASSNSSSGTASNEVVTPDPKFFIEIKAVDPLQVTVTRTSVQLIKDLAEAYSREYGKKVEGHVSLMLLTGAPFTIINKLGPGTPISVAPGKSLKFSKAAQSVKVKYNEFVDLEYIKNRGHISYASLVTPEIKDIGEVDLNIDDLFHTLQAVPIDTPGNYYYQLVAKESSLTPNASVVVDIDVTGAKKSINIRSSVQVHNHLTTPIELLSIPIKGEPRLLVTLDPGEIFPIPFNALLTALSLRPPLQGYSVSQSHFFWQTLKEQSQLDLICTSAHGKFFRIRILIEEECYKSQKGLPDGVYAHHIFHIYPLAVLQNLLPSDLTIESEDASFDSFTLKPGDSQELHFINLSRCPNLIVMLPYDMIGSVRLPHPLPEEIGFLVGRDRFPVTLSILHDDLGYHRLALYCPFWMINKTGLTLQYKDDKSNKLFKHPPELDLTLLSCDDRKNCKISVCCITKHDNRTEWSRSISLQAVGTSGQIVSRLPNSNVCYHFGIAVTLSTFTLSKLVVITPYYLLVNHSSSDITVYEERAPDTGTTVSSGEMVPFWPITDSCRLSVAASKGSKSIMFNYKTTDSLVLRFSEQPVALCVDIQETENSNIITFSSYYDTCTPVHIINLLNDGILRFKQDAKGASPVYSLVPGESIHYTWDNPAERRLIKWGIKGAQIDTKPIDITKDASEGFNYQIDSRSLEESVNLSLLTTPTALRGKSESLMTSRTDTWISVDSEHQESLIVLPNERPSYQQRPSDGPQHRRGYWNSFIDTLQRTLVFTDNPEIVDIVKAADSLSQNIFELSLSMRSIGLSLVDNKMKREVAYIGITQSGVIWQVSRKRGLWKTLNNTVIALLEEGYQSKSIDVRHKDLIVNLEKMEMFAPLQGKLRRTNYDGVQVRAGMSKKDYSLHAKIGFVQIDNQLPFSVYPQLLYPLPPPPTVASTTEPKPFLEASVILHRSEHQNINHFKYVHVLIQRMVVNVDLGFILALVDFFSFSDSDYILEPEYVRRDLEFSSKSLQGIVLPAASDETVKRNFFNVLHLSPIKITLSFNVRSVGRNAAVQTVGDRFLQLFLHSLGVILTSVQEAQMNFSLFHLENTSVNVSKLTDLLLKHYKTQALVQLHRLILGLDVLGNPVKVVRGVVEGTFDLFYEPIKGSVLGPEEFAAGLGLGLRSFFGGTVGGLTGAGARITGAFGDVFAKLTFDDTFIDRRQQEKVKSTKFGSKVGGFFKNVAEGVTGVVVQPIKGVKEEGAVGFLKGTGRGLVGFLVRPTGGLIDLTSGTLEFVTRKTRVGNVDIIQLRPPRFIGRDGVIRPYSPEKAIGNALLVGTDEGGYTESDSYVGHYEMSSRPPQFLVVTDRQYMIIGRRALLEDWKSVQRLEFKHVTDEAFHAQNIIYIPADNSKYSRECQLNVSSEKEAKEISTLINTGYNAFKENFSS